MFKKSLASLCTLALLSCAAEVSAGDFDYKKQLSTRGSHT